MRYFMVTSLVAFSVVGVTLFLLQGMEIDFFAEVQSEQSRFFATTQKTLAREQDDTARRNLVAVHEAGHVDLTRLFANVLWHAHFLPFVAQAHALPADECRALPDAPGADDIARKTCYAELGRKIMALPGFAALDAEVYATMRNSSVFKIKVYDLRGITVYSSEHAQIGEDKADNQGWISAMAGRPASELTHRHRFSAFEGDVENRDLISSYVPIRTDAGGEIRGVFEIYSDVTPLLAQIDAAAARTAELSAANQAALDRAAAENEAKVMSSSARFLAIVGSLLAVLYLALLLLVRNGQRIIDLQAQAQERAARREQEWHREKMAALAAMAANVSHEVGNPLAVIQALAQRMDGRSGDEGDERAPRQIIEQTRRIAEMTRQIAEFASARSEKAELVDVNRTVQAMCSFLGFDGRFGGTPIEFRPGDDLPAYWLVPDHLNEVLMTLLQACVAEGGEATPHQGGRIVVATSARGDDIVVRIGCEGAVSEGIAHAAAQSDTRFEAARRRIADMGASLTLRGDAVEIVLPASPLAEVEAG